MKKKRRLGSPKQKIALAAALVGTLFCVLTAGFIRDVRKQLWEQSVGTIMESTQQGCDALKLRLSDDYASMHTVADQLETVPVHSEEELETAVSHFGRLEGGVSLYLEDGALFPSGAAEDEEAMAFLSETQQAEGIIDPHISSATGVNVFDLFVRVELLDGTRGHLLKEYEIDGIVDSFSLSFYNNAGFSYVVNTEGDVLIRSPHPNSNKTVKNLFDMLPEEQNDPESLQVFSQSLKNAYTGWAVFTYQGERTVFCYTPLELQSDWYLISIIPERVVNAQTNEILMRSLLLIGSIILGIALLLAGYLWYASRTNRRLRNQANYIGHLYNAIPEGIALITVDAPYRVAQLNREGLRLMGYPQETANDALQGRLVEEIVYPEDYQYVLELLRQTIRRGEKNVFEHRTMKADGSYFWTGGIIEKTLGEDGNPVLISAFHDITAEKLAQEAAEWEKLQERLTLVGAISNAYPVIISMNLTSDTLSFVYVKPGLMLGLGSQKAYSELYRDMEPTIHADQAETFRARFSPENLRRALEDGKSEVFLESRQLLMDGNYHWTSTQIISVDNPYSEEMLAILISRRIDEQREEEEQRRQALQSALDNARNANTAKSRFLSNMSHDIRTPMNAIVGMTAIAASHLDDRERVLECLNKIGFSSRHLLSLINDVLDMSKIESGKLSLRDEPFNFAELAADSVELVRPQAGVKDLQMDVKLERLKEENVLGDPLRIRQVFLNILSNAVKYTPKGGGVRVAVRQEESAYRGRENYVFRCSDTGVGMSPEFLKRLFQPFERAQDSTSSRIVGTGLGMAITKNLVELMNGDIQVESAPGGGTTVTVTLPLRLQDAPEAQVPPKWEGVRSLIVDDDQQTCENAAELLRDLGLRPQFVTEGKAAVACISEAKGTADPFQLAIVDWKMPDMDGVEVARRIRKEAGPDLPVIILTAYDWAEIESEAREAGVTAFLSKPFYRAKVCYLLHELDGETEGETRPLPAEKPDYSRKRLLLVEDNELNREIARELIRESGVQIEEAWDGAEAVRKVKESPEGFYDLILMDVQMPVMDGYEATRAIRALDRRDAGQVPIVAMTANAFEEDVRAALRAGMNAHFAKPVEAETLEAILARYLSGPASPGGEG